MPMWRSIRRLKRHEWLAHYARGQWRALALILALTAITPLITALSPWPMKLLVDRALGAEQTAASASLLDRLPLPQSSTGLLIAAGAASLALFAAAALLESALSFTWSLAGRRMVHELSADLFHRLQRLTPLYHTRRSVGDLLSRLTGDAWAVYVMIEGLLISPLRDVLTLACVAVIAWQLDPAMTLLSLAVAPALAAIAVVLGPKLKKRTQGHRQVESRLYSFVHQTIGAIPLVQSFATEQRNSRQFRELASAAVQSSQRGSLLKNTYGFLTALTTTLGTAVVIFFGARRVLAGVMTVGDLLVFIAYLRTMHGSAQGLLRVHATLKSAEASAERVTEVLSSEERVVERPDAVAAPVAIGRGAAVALEDVTFGYAPGEPVLRGVTLRVEPGQALAIIGRTGAGKSTLAALIARLLDPWKGRVLLDERDVRELTLASLRQRVAVVPQESLLLPVSLAENIAYGRPEATPAEIEAAADAAGALEFIRRLPNGFETILGERGCTLSAGQRQRIAIARALLKEAPVLVLDEPTSALDVRTERSVMAAVQRLKGSRTVILIAHRLSTARVADRVAVIEDGRVVREGTPDEVLDGEDDVAGAVAASAEVAS